MEFVEFPVVDKKSDNKLDPNSEEYCRIQSMEESLKYYIWLSAPHAIGHAEKIGRPLSSKEKLTVFIIGTASEPSEYLLEKVKSPEDDFVVAYNLLISKVPIYYKKHDYGGPWPPYVYGFFKKYLSTDDKQCVVNYLISVGGISVAKTFATKVLDKKLSNTEIAKKLTKNDRLSIISNACIYDNDPYFINPLEGIIAEKKVKKILEEILPLYITEGDFYKARNIVGYIDRDFGRKELTTIIEVCEKKGMHHSSRDATALLKSYPTN